MFGVGKPADKRWAEPFGTAALHIVLQRHTLRAIQRLAALEHLADPFGAVAGAPGPVQRIRVVVGGDALIGTRHVATRRVDHGWQRLEWDVAAPLIGRLMRIAIAAHAPPADRHAPGALGADSAGGVG